MVGQLANVDAKIADRVANGLGLSSVSPVHTTVPARENLAPSPALSILGKAKPTLEGRMIGCLIADGADTTTVLALESAVLKQKADFKIVAPKVGGATGADGNSSKPTFNWPGAPRCSSTTSFLPSQRKVRPLSPVKQPRSLGSTMRSSI